MNVWRVVQAIPMEYIEPSANTLQSVMHTYIFSYGLRAFIMQDMATEGGLSCAASVGHDRVQYLNLRAKISFCTADPIANVSSVVVAGTQG